MSVPHRVELDDCSLEITEGGSGPPLLVLHGFLETPVWGPYHELLAQRHRVIVPAHPGFAASTRPPWMHTVEDLAYLYLDLIQRLGLRDVVLVGHSLGGWIATELAVRDCHALAKLILVDAVGLRTLPTPVGPAGGSVADWLVMSPAAVRALALHSPLTADKLRLPGDPGLTQEELEAIFRDREAASVYGWNPFFFNPQLQRWLHRIAVPTLVVWGEHDGIVSQDVGRAYAEGIPNAQLRILPATAHLPHLERPEALVDLVEGFLDGHAAPAEIATSTSTAI